MVGVYLPACIFPCFPALPGSEILLVVCHWSTYSVLTSSQALVGPVEVGRGDQEQVQWDLEVSTTVSAVAPVGDHEARWYGGRRVVILHQRGAAAAPAEGPGGL